VLVVGKCERRGCCFGVEKEGGGGGGGGSARLLVGHFLQNLLASLHNVTLNQDHLLTNDPFQRWVPAYDNHAYESADCTQPQGE